MSVAKVFQRLAQLFLSAGQIDNAFKYCYMSAALAQKTEDLTAQSQALHILAQVQDRHGESHLALNTALQSGLLAKAAGNLSAEALSLLLQARMSFQQGNLGHAFALLQQCQSLVEALGLDTKSTLHRHLIFDLTNVHLMKTEYEDAQKWISKLLQLDAELNSYTQISSWALLIAVEIDICIGQVSDESIVQSIENVRHKFSDTGGPRGSRACDMTLGDLYFKQGHYDKAKKLYSQSLSSAYGTCSDQEIECFAALSNVARKQQNTQILLQNIVLFLAFARKIQSFRSTLQACYHLGEYFCQVEDMDTALSLLKLALKGFTSMDIHRSRGDCFLHIGDILKMQGQINEAREMWQKARPLFVRSMQTQDVGQCDQRLLSAVTLSLDQVGA